MRELIPPWARKMVKASDRYPPYARCRAFLLSDAMVMIAATGFGLAGSVVYGQGSVALEDLPFARPTDGPIVKSVLRSCGLASLWLAAWSLAMLWIRLRRPRPNLSRLSRQPGFGATLPAAGSFAVVMGPVTCLLLLRALPTFQEPSWYHPSAALFFRCAYNLRLPYLMCGAVIGSWSVASLTGRWEPEPGWIDRIGTALGVGWILLLLVQSCAETCSYISFNFMVYPPSPIAP